MTPAPPLAAGTGGAGSAIGSLLAGGGQGAPGAGADQIRQQLEALMGQIRDVGQMVDALAADFPTLAPDVQQVKQLLKQMVVKAAQQAPTQTASGAAVPGGGA